MARPAGRSGAAAGARRRPESARRAALPEGRRTPTARAPGYRGSGAAAAVLPAYCRRPAAGARRSTPAPAASPRTATDVEVVRRSFLPRRYVYSEERSSALTYAPMAATHVLLSLLAAGYAATGRSGNVSSVMVFEKGEKNYVGMRIPSILMIPQASLPTAPALTLPSL